MRSPINGGRNKIGTTVRSLAMKPRRGKMSWGHTHDKELQATTVPYLNTEGVHHASLTITEKQTFAKTLY